MTQPPPDMTLRDYFAGQALLLISDVRVVDKDEDFAKRAYELADAMLKVRMPPEPEVQPVPVEPEPHAGHFPRKR